MTEYLKNHKLSSITYLLIFIASVMPVPEVKPLVEINLFDKWVHFIMYATLSISVWWDIYHTRQHKSFGISECLKTTLYPALFGGLMELVQRYCTFGIRSGDWIDALANTIGVTIGFLIGFFIIRKIYA